MIILGLDPGIARTGYGVLDTNQPNPYITAGCLETPASFPSGPRLTILARELHELIHSYHPDLAVIEQVYFARNRTTAVVTAQVHGVFLHVLDVHGIPTEHVTPLHVKRRLTGHGQATKRHVQQAVADRLNLKIVPQPDDVADALAVALCSLQDGSWCGNPPGESIDLKSSNQ